MHAISSEIGKKIISLFKKNLTVNEIANKTGVSAKNILLWLTSKGFWSQYCSSCMLKRCYECRGLQELGKPISTQDQIDLIANFRKNDREAIN